MWSYDVCHFLKIGERRALRNRTRATEVHATEGPVRSPAHRSPPKSTLPYSPPKFTLQAPHLKVRSPPGLYKSPSPRKPTNATAKGHNQRIKLHVPGGTYEERVLRKVPFPTLCHGPTQAWSSFACLFWVRKSFPFSICLPVLASNIKCIF